MGLDFAGMMEDLKNFPDGSVIVLHGKCLWHLPVLLAIQAIMFCQHHKGPLLPQVEDRQTVCPLTVEVDPITVQRMYPRLEFPLFWD